MTHIRILRHYIHTPFLISAVLEAVAIGVAAYTGYLTRYGTLPDFSQHFPFALTFVAIPLESFVGSSRTVMGKVAAVTLRWLAFLLRLSGNIASYLGELMVNLYDLVIFPSLWVEGLVKGMAQGSEMESEEEIVVPTQAVMHQTDISPQGEPL